jgi:hypothetical protein
MGVQNVGRSSIMSHNGGQPAIQPQPHEPLGKLVQRKEARHRRKEQLAPVLDFSQRHHSDGTQYGAADKVCAS